MDCPHTLVMRTPASWKGSLWREALPLGNGTVGALVYGSVHKETILLTHGALWHGLKRDVLPDIHTALAETRNLMEAKCYAQANVHLQDALTSHGYDAHIPEPFPLADVSITMPVQAGFSHYRRCLHMDTGEAVVAYQDGDNRYLRSVFVSRDRDIIVCKIVSESRELNVLVSLDLHDETDSQFPLDDEEIRRSVVRAMLPEQRACFFEGTLHSESSDYGSHRFGAVLQASGDGCTCSVYNGQLRATGGKQLCIVIRPYVDDPSGKPLESSLDYLNSFEHDYAKLLEAHVALHAPLFHSASLQLGNKRRTLSVEELLLEAYDGEASPQLLQTLWEFGRYLAISSLREGGLPCPLHGLWCGDYHPIWSQHVINENLQMIHWHLGTGNLLPLMMPVFDYFDSLLPDFRQCARQLFGCRGIVVPAYTAPGIGLPTVLVPVILHWTGGAPWVGSLYYHYAKLSGDAHFTRARAIPFLKEVALFYEDFLVEDPEGILHVVPSVSPENSPANHVPAHYDGLSHPMPTTRDATMDIALIREVLSNLIDLHESIGLGEPDIDRWKQMIGRLPAYRINGDGALAEWIDPDFDDNYFHRHMVHLYPLFPGNEVTADSNPALFKACETAIGKRLEFGLSEQCNWSYVHIAHVQARMRNGDRALSSLDLFARSCLMGNLFSASNDWRRMGITLDFSLMPFQIDGNMGIVSALQELLVQTTKDTLFLLPALPARFATGSFERFSSLFCTVSCTWDFSSLEPVVSGVLQVKPHTAFMFQVPDRFSLMELVFGSGGQRIVRGSRMLVGNPSDVPLEVRFSGRICRHK